MVPTLKGINIMNLKSILDSILIEYLQNGLEGEGVEGQLNLLKASIAKEVVLRIKADLAFNEINKPCNKI